MAPPLFARSPLMQPASLPTLLGQILLTVSAAMTVGCATKVSPDLEDAASDGATTDAVTDNGPTSDHACAAAVERFGTCSATLRWSCGVPEALSTHGEPYRGHPAPVCYQYCPGANEPGVYVSCGTLRTDAGTEEFRCGYCASGRRSEGLDEPDHRAPGNEVGAFLANCATLECASVTAFDRLHDKLADLGAPASLLHQLLVAADEERDHTARMTDAARAWGVHPEEPHFAPTAPRTRASLALENMVEGCVRETYGALVAAWQGAHATDRDLAQLFTHLADDEARHAALSWSLHAWLAEGLSDDERCRLDDAREATIAALEADALRPLPSCLQDTVGLPNAAAQRALLGALRTTVWSRTNLAPTA